jgi:hypothetical protein
MLYAGAAPVMQKVPLPVSQAEPNYTVAVQPATSVASASSMSAWVHHMAPPTNLGMMKKGRLLVSRLFYLSSLF